MEDSKIIELFFERSEEALTWVDEKYGRPLRSLSFNILHNDQDAEECVNDTYMVLWNKIPPAKPDPFYPYACKITRNVSLARHKYNTAQKRDPSGNVCLEEIADFLPAEDETGKHLQRAEMSAILGAWLDTLDERNFYIFMRRFWFMDSTSSIATELGVSESAVYLRLDRMKKKLRRFLKDRGIIV